MSAVTLADMNAVKAKLSQYAASPDAWYVHPDFAHKMQHEMRVCNRQREIAADARIFAAFAAGYKAARKRCGGKKLQKAFVAFCWSEARAEVIE